MDDVKYLKFTACQLMYTFMKAVFEGLSYIKS